MLQQGLCFRSGWPEFRPPPAEVDVEGYAQQTATRPPTETGPGGEAPLASSPRPASQDWDQLVPRQPSRETTVSGNSPAPLF